MKIIPCAGRSAPHGIIGKIISIIYGISMQSFGTTAIAAV